MTDTPPVAAASGSASHTFTLAAPIARGETAIEALTIRKPSAGQLRGLSLQSLLSLDITAILTVTPRITMPPITRPRPTSLTLPTSPKSGARSAIFL
jgi:hypothetical protein